jgi:hypothetical protein
VIDSYKAEETASRSTGHPGRPHHSGAPADLPDNASQCAVGPDPTTMLPREVVIRQEGNED